MSKLINLHTGLMVFSSLWTCHVFHFYSCFLVSSLRSHSLSGCSYQPTSPRSTQRKRGSVCAQLKEQTDGWLSNDTKNTTNPAFWHTESDGEHWGQIKTGHVGNGFWLSSPPCQRLPLFLCILSFSKIWAVVFFVFFFYEYLQIWRWETTITRSLFCVWMN